MIDSTNLVNLIFVLYGIGFPIFMIARYLTIKRLQNRDEKKRQQEHQETLNKQYQAIQPQYIQPQYRQPIIETKDDLIIDMMKTIINNDNLSCNERITKLKKTIKDK